MFLWLSAGLAGSAGSAGLVGLASSGGAAGLVGSAIGSLGLMTATNPVGPIRSRPKGCAGLKAPALSADSLWLGTSVAVAEPMGMDSPANTLNVSGTAVLCGLLDSVRKMRLATSFAGPIDPPGLMGWPWPYSSKISFVQGSSPDISGGWLQAEWGARWASAGAALHWGCVSGAWWSWGGAAPLLVGLSAWHLGWGQNGADNPPRANLHGLLLSTANRVGAPVQSAEAWIVGILALHFVVAAWMQHTARLRGFSTWFQVVLAAVVLSGVHYLGRRVEAELELYSYGVGYAGLWTIGMEWEAGRPCLGVKVRYAAGGGVLLAGLLGLSLLYTAGDTPALAAVFGGLLPPLVAEMFMEIGQAVIMRVHQGLVSWWSAGELRPMRRHGGLVWDFDNVMSAAAVITLRLQASCDLSASQLSALEAAGALGRFSPGPRWSMLWRHAMWMVQLLALTSLLCLGAVLLVSRYCSHGILYTFLICTFVVEMYFARCSIHAVAACCGPGTTLLDLPHPELATAQATSVMIRAGISWSLVRSKRRVVASWLLGRSGMDSLLDTPRARSLRMIAVQEEAASRGLLVPTRLVDGHSPSHRGRGCQTGRGDSTSATRQPLPARHGTTPASQVGGEDGGGGGEEPPLPRGNNGPTDVIDAGMYCGVCLERIGPAEPTSVVDGALVHASCLLDGPTFRGQAARLSPARQEQASDLVGDWCTITDIQNELWLCVAVIGSNRDALDRLLMVNRTREVICEPSNVRVANLPKVLAPPSITTRHRGVRGDFRNVYRHGDFVDAMMTVNHTPMCLGARNVRGCSGEDTRAAFESMSLLYERSAWLRRLGVSRTGSSPVLEHAPGPVPRGRPQRRLPQTQRPTRPQESPEDLLTRRPSREMSTALGTAASFGVSPAPPPSGPIGASPARGLPSSGDALGRAAAAARLPRGLLLEVRVALSSQSNLEDTLYHGAAWSISHESQSLVVGSSGSTTGQRAAHCLAALQESLLHVIQLCSADIRVDLSRVSVIMAFGRDVEGRRRRSESQLLPVGGAGLAVLYSALQGWQSLAAFALVPYEPGHPSWTRWAPTEGVRSSARRVANHIADHPPESRVAADTLAGARSLYHALDLSFPHRLPAVTPRQTEVGRHSRELARILSQPRSHEGFVWAESNLVVLQTGLEFLRGSIGEGPYDVALTYLRACRDQRALVRQSLVVSGLDFPEPTVGGDIIAAALAGATAQLSAQRRGLLVTQARDLAAAILDSAPRHQPVTGDTIVSSRAAACLLLPWAEGEGSLGMVAPEEVTAVATLLGRPIRIYAAVEGMEGLRAEAFGPRAVPRGLLGRVSSFRESCLGGGGGNGELTLLSQPYAAFAFLPLIPNQVAIGAFFARRRLAFELAQSPAASPRPSAVVQAPQPGLGPVGAPGEGGTSVAPDVPVGTAVNSLHTAGPQLITGVPPSNLSLGAASVPNEDRRLVVEHRFLGRDGVATRGDSLSARALKLHQMVC